MARETHDKDNVELVRILQELLDQNIDITAREIVRRHSSLSSASTITRHPSRRQLVEEHQLRQAEMRQWQIRLGKQSKDQVAQKLAAQESKIADLDQTVRILVTGHVGLIAAVAQVGGMGKLSKFYESFREVRNTLSDIGAIPADFPSPDIIRLRQPSTSSNVDDQ
jgi:hypothetical protein